MKKLIPILLLFACSEHEIIIPDGANARTQSLCNVGYPWGTWGNSSPDQTIIPNIHFKKNVNFSTSTYPANWSAKYNPSSGATYRYGIQIKNNGAATFKYSTKNGSVWQTLTPGQSNIIYKDFPECDVTGYSVLLVVDLYRLSCGQMICEVRASSAESPHSLTGFNAPDFNMTWNAPACTL